MYDTLRFFIFISTLDEEGRWIWSSNGVGLTDSFWGPNQPNTNLNNTEDCGIMALLPYDFWWEDCHCLSRAVNMDSVAPICQHERILSLCPDGASFEGHCYLLFATEHLDWRGAEYDCISRGGHLTSIHSQAEEEFIMNLVAGSTAGQTWLGASDSFQEVTCINIFSEKVKLNK